MEDIVQTVLLMIFGAINTGFVGNYFITKRKRQDDLLDLEKRVHKLELEAVKEYYVKELINDTMEPIKDVLGEIKDMMTHMQDDITEIKVKQAHQEGLEEARKEALANINSVNNS